MGETGECSTYTVIWQCFGVCLFVVLFVRKIELPRLCLFVIQIENLQIDKHVELLVLKIICCFCTTESLINRTNWWFYSATVFKTLQRGKKVICLFVYL
jgi:hypothetical protein